LGRTGACGFDWVPELVHKCEGEVNGRDRGASPTAEEHGQRQWRGGGGPTRWRKRLGHGEACGLGVERRGSVGVLWGRLNRLGGAPGGGSPAAWPSMATALMGN
jgi:hypothetical protein